MKLRESMGPVVLISMFYILSLVILTNGMPQQLPVTSNELPPWSDEEPAGVVAGRAGSARERVPGEQPLGGQPLLPGTALSTSRERPVFDLLALRAIFDMMLGVLYSLREAAAGNTERARSAAVAT